MYTRNKYKKIKLKDGTTIDEHRLIIENIIGRKLNRNEVVHHKDGDKSNNNLSNLELLSREAHSRLHKLGSPPISTKTKDKLSKIQQNIQANNNKEWVIEVKNMLSNGERQVDISKTLNISKYTISRISRGVCFSYIS